ncbi:MAG: sulfotransferase domain-containing protein [Phycisphaerales bacterium JB063]
MTSKLQHFAIAGRFQRYGPMIRLSHHATRVLAGCFPKAIPLVHVLGYPKSGTTWVCRLVADYLQLPHPQLSIFPIGFPAIMHGHQTVSKKRPHSVYVVRDGRDVMVSYYFFMTRNLGQNANTRAERKRSRFFPPNADRNDIRANLPHFIKAHMTQPIASRINWPNHVQSYLRAGLSDIPLLRYEALLEDGQSALAKAMSTLTGEPADEDSIADALARHAFQKQKRKDKHVTEDKQADSPLRKGVHGDWKNHFTQEAAEVFHTYAGETLIQLGYETSSEWVSNCPSECLH